MRIILAERTRCTSNQEKKQNYYEGETGKSIEAAAAELD